MSFRLVNHSCWLKTTIFQNRKLSVRKSWKCWFLASNWHTYTRDWKIQKASSYIKPTSGDLTTFFFSVPSFTINMVCGYKFNPFSGYFTFGCSIFCASFFFFNFFYLLGRRTRRNKLFLLVFGFCVHALVLYTILSICICDITMNRTDSNRSRCRSHRNF